MHGIRILVAALAVPLLLTLAGCCCGGHSRGKTHGGRISVPAPAAGAATSGRQLEDLRAAHRSGAISGDEYELARRRLLGAGGDTTPLQRRP